MEKLRQSTVDLRQTAHDTGSRPIGEILSE
jgi:hypothetical protein